MSASAAFADDLTVARVGAHAAHTMPGRCALDDGRRRLTYAELDARVEAIGTALCEAGVGRDDVVCVYLPNCIEYVIVVLAVARAGAIFSPLNPRFKPYELGTLLGDARPRVLFTMSERRVAIEDALAQAGVERPVIVVIDATEGYDPGMIAFEEWLGRPAQPRPVVRESQFFSLMFTSGTTGRPKGALGTHRARMLWVLNAAIQYGLDEDDRYLGVMPLVHSAGLTFALMHLYVGATVRILDPFDAAMFLDVVAREQVSSVLAVPTMLTMVLDALDREGQHHDLSSLARVVTCGSPLAPSTRRAVIERLSAQLYDYYGSTESNSMTVLKPRDQLRKLGSVGQPFTNVELMIAGPNGIALPAGSIGEVWCSNPSAMTCYRDRPADTAAAFTGRWFRTGDLGYLDDEGYLFLNGRVSDVIISGGINVYPAEIEQVLMLHPAVLDCAIVGMPDLKWGESVKAFVVARPGTSIDLAELQRHCAAHLADYKKPRALEIVSEIPKNAGGKSMKSLLVESARETA